MNGALPALLIAALAGGQLWVGKFAGNGGLPPGWTIVPYPNKKPTHYRQATIKGVPAIEAQADSSMALLARPITVNLETTPILCWRWLVDSPIAAADMRQKSGDDYAARVYVAFSMPKEALSAGTRLKLNMARKLFGRPLPDAAVVYVWENRQPVGTARKSAYTDRSQLIVAETGSSRAGTWVSEHANVAADFARAFGGKPGKPTQLAVATDGDDTKSKAHAAFADIHFAATANNCFAS